MRAGTGVWRAIVTALASAVVASAAVAPAVAQPKWPSSSAPRPLQGRDVKFPPYEIRTLPNGLVLVVVGHGEQPAVSIRLIVRAGAAQDPAGKPGVASMVAGLLDQGTTTRSALEVADTIDSAGGALSTGGGRDLSYANITVMKDGLALGMELLSDVLRRPAFAQDELDRQRQKLLAALRVSYTDPGYLANVVFDRLVYGSHPYGTPEDGTPASVEAITRDDLVAYHRRYYVPNNCLMAVVGDVTTDEAVAAVTRAFGDWPRRDVPGAPVSTLPKPARRVVVLDKPDAVQTEVRMGQLGLARKDGDFVTASLAMRILGGEGGNRLHHVLRSERGLTYGAQADLDTLRLAGEMVAQTNTRTESTGEVVRLMTEEFWRLRRERVDERELDDAKAYLTGHFPLTIETPNQIATQVLDVLFYELPLEQLQTFRRRVNDVTPEAIDWVANHYVQPDRLSVVLVGNAAGFIDQLRRVGFNKVEVIELNDLDLAAANLKRQQGDAVPAGRAVGAGGRWPSSLPDPLSALRSDARFQDRQQAGATPPSTSSVSPEPPSESQAAARDTAATVIARAIAAKGGLDALRGVKTLMAVTKTTIHAPQGELTTRTTTYVQYPDKFRVEARVPIGQVVQVFAGGDRAWVRDPAKGLVEPPADVRKDLRDSVQRDVLSLLLRAQAGEIQARLVDLPQAEAGNPLRCVVLSGPGLEPVSLYIDDVTGMVTQESYDLPGGDGVADESFADYRDVGGVKIAFTAALHRGGRLVLTRTVTDVKVNVPIDPALFAKPERQP